MKKYFLFSALVLAFACSKDDDNNTNPTPSTPLVDVVDGRWNVVNVERIDEGDVQGSSYYLNFAMDTSGVYFDFDLATNMVDFWQYYKGTDAATQTSVDVSDEFLDVPFQITGNSSMEFYALGDTVNVTALSVSQNTMTLRTVNEFVFPGFYEKQTLTYYLAR